MIIALILAVIVAGIALVIAAAALARVSSVSPPLIGKSVVVHTRKPDDRTIRGVLHGEYADRWVIRDATVVLPGGREQALGGIEHVPTSNISFAQEMEVPVAIVNGDQP